MKFVKTTLVDAITGIPCTEAPTRNGHVIPDGVSLVFDIEDSRIPSLHPWATPTIYGVVEGDVPQHCQEVDEESFWQIFKQEILDRAHRKRKEVELGGIFIGDVFIKTDEEDQNKISRTIDRSQEAGITNISFKSGSGFIDITIEDLKGIAIEIAKHVQDCFLWESEVHKHVNELDFSLENLDSIYSVLEEIDLFGVDLHTPQEEEEELLNEEAQG